MRLILLIREPQANIVNIPDTTIAAEECLYRIFNNPTSIRYLWLADLNAMVGSTHYILVGGHHNYPFDVMLSRPVPILITGIILLQDVYGTATIEVSFYNFY